MNRLITDSVTKSFGDRKILTDVYLSVAEGDIAVILGRNGSGKSTLLQIIFGTLKGDTQYIRYNDTVLKNQFDRKLRIAHLPQYSFLPKNIKVINLIHLFCSTENSDFIKNSDFVKPYIHEKVSQLSAGEIRLIEAMLIIFSPAKFVILDEPFRNLSPKNISKLKNIILQQSEHKGFIVSDHQFQYLSDIYTDLYMLSESHLKSIKDLTELKSYNYVTKNI